MDEKETNIVKPKSGLAIAGLVLGIVAICVSFIPAVGMAAIFLAIVGLILSAIGIKGTGVNAAKCGRGMAIAGLVLCLVAAVISITQQAVCSAAIDAADEATTSTTATTDDGKAEESDNNEDEENSTAKEAKQDIAQKLSDGEFSVVKKAKGKKEAMGALYISGTLKNETDEDKSYVQVSFNVLDKDGNLIGTAFANVNHLKAGGTWKYKAMCADADGYKKFEMSEITSY